MKLPKDTKDNQYTVQQFEKTGGAKFKPGRINKNNIFKFFSNKKILLGMLLLIITLGSLTVFILSRKSDTTSTDELNDLFSSAPIELEQQKTWAKTVSDKLESENYKREGSGEEKTNYYNKLIGLYNVEQNDSKARAIYVSEVKPAGIVLSNVALLNWLYNSFIIAEDYQNANNIIDDMVSVYSESINQAENETDKTNMKNAIEELKMKKRAL